MKNLFIDIVAFGTLFSSILVITSKNPVIAVIFLISTFINAACYLMLIGVGFLGLTYIILYVGAITVLFLFVIMLLNIRLSEILETSTQYTKNLPLAFAISLLFIYEFFTIIPFSLNDVSIISSLLNLISYFNAFLLNLNSFNENIVYLNIDLATADTTFINFTQIQAIGFNLYTYGALWLIICSMILLLALVAPIFISKNNNNNKI